MCQGEGEGAPGPHEPGWTPGGHILLTMGSVICICPKYGSGPPLNVSDVAFLPRATVPLSHLGLPQWGRIIQARVHVSPGPAWHALISCLHPFEEGEGKLDTLRLIYRSPISFHTFSHVIPTRP